MLSLPAHTRTPLLLAVVLCIGLIGTIWFQSNTGQDPALANLPSGSHTPEWFGRNVMSIKMNVDGTPQYQIWAEMLTHYGDDNTTDLIQPRFQQFAQADNEDVWLLESEKGRIFHGDKVMEVIRLDLWQNVYLSRPELSKQTPFNMTTSTIAIFPAKSFATTDQTVLLTQPGHTMQGKGMELFFDSKELKLLNDVRSMHVTK